MVESVGVYVHCAMFLSLKKNFKNINIWNVRRTIDSSILWFIFAKY